MKSSSPLKKCQRKELSYTRFSISSISLEDKPYSSYTSLSISSFSTFILSNKSLDFKVRNNLFYETSNKNYSVYVRDSKNVDVYDNYTLFDKVNDGYKILHTGSNNDEDTITQNNNNLGGR